MRQRRLLIGALQGLAAAVIAVAAMGGRLAAQGATGEQSLFLAVRAVILLAIVLVYVGFVTPGQWSTATADRSPGGDTLSPDRCQRSLLPG